MRTKENRLPTIQEVYNIMYVEMDSYHAILLRYDITKEELFKLCNNNRMTIQKYKNKWSKEEDQFIIDNQEKSSQEIAEKMLVRESQVCSRKRHLRREGVIAKHNPSAETDEREKIILEFINTNPKGKNVTRAEIARALNMQYEKVQSAVKRGNIKINGLSNSRKDFQKKIKTVSDYVNSVNGECSISEITENTGIHYQAIRRILLTNPEIKISKTTEVLERSKKTQVNSTQKNKEEFIEIIRSGKKVDPVALMKKFSYCFQTMQQYIRLCGGDLEAYKLTDKHIREYVRQATPIVINMYKNGYTKKSITAKTGMVIKQINEILENNGFSCLKAERECRILNLSNEEMRRRLREYDIVAARDSEILGELDFKIKRSQCKDDFEYYNRNNMYIRPFGKDELKAIKEGTYEDRDICDMYRNVNWI